MKLGLGVCGWVGKGIVFCLFWDIDPSWDYITQFPATLTFLNNAITITFLNNPATTTFLNSR